MEDALPSYETATTKDYWPIIAEFIQSSDLCSAALVSRSWYQVFAPHLWGNPASHFSTQDDAVYVALTRFKRTLLWARLRTRELTHTLQLPPAHAEIYEGPHADWLRDILDRLPRLQSLILDELPFFDHGCLVALQYHSSLKGRVPADTSPTYTLRLLDARQCSNATSTGLAEALRHFPALLSLDLSRTLSVKDPAVLSALRFLPNLQVLKLEGLGLKDGDLEIVAGAIGRRVRSLDVRCNALTDHSARVLLEQCFRAPEQLERAPEAKTDDYEDWPSGLRPHLGADILDGYRGENLDRHLRRWLTRGVASRLAIEDAAGMGITHLYISGNRLTVEGVSGLLRSTRLHVLDAGSVAKPLISSKMASSGTGAQIPDLPDVEKMTPILAKYASQSLTYLRINHAVVTKEAPAADFVLAPAEMEGSHAVNGVAITRELGEVPALLELDAIPMYHELPSEPEFRFELEGSPAPACLRPKITVKACESVLERPHPVRRRSAFAPEVGARHVPIATGSGLASEAGLMNGVGVYSTAQNLSSFAGAPRARTRTYSSIVEGRRARLDLRQSQNRHLLPTMLPRLRTLVLTDLPMMATTPEIARRLIQFITYCAEESQLTKLQAKLTYALPPGRSRKAAERDYARSLFALQNIVLEMAPDPRPTKSATSSWRKAPSMSSTNDADTEAFWNAARYDFSFFGDEECGQPDGKTRQLLSLAAMTEKVVVVPDEGNGLQSVAREVDENSEPAAVQRFDVVGEISAFRKGRKAAYEAAKQYGEHAPAVEGYWDGKVSIVRPQGPEQSGNIDYYGNHFEKGYSYR